MIDQQERADAYYKNMVAMMFFARCALSVAVQKFGDESIEAAGARARLRGILSTVESIEAGEYYETCGACGKPLLDGQQSITYEDIGRTHALCGDPMASTSESDPVSIEYDSGFRPARCSEEISLAKAALREPEAA